MPDSIGERLARLTSKLEDRGADTVARSVRALTNDAILGSVKPTTFAEATDRVISLAKKAEKLPAEVRGSLLTALRSDDVPEEVRQYLSVAGADETFALAVIGIAPVAIMYAEGRPLREIAELLDVPYLVLHSFVNRPDNRPMMDEARAALATDAVDLMFRRATLAEDSAAVSALKWLAERLSGGAYAPAQQAEAPSASASLSITIDASADALLEKMNKRREVYEATVKKLDGPSKAVSMLDEMMGGAVEDADVVEEP